MSAEDFINDKRWKDITAELDKLGREILPNAPLNGFSQLGNRYEARLSQNQAEYQKSPYFYEKEKMFFHPNIPSQTFLHC